MVYDDVATQDEEVEGSLGDVGGSTYAAAV